MQAARPRFKATSDNMAFIMIVCLFYDAQASYVTSVRLTATPSKLLIDADLRCSHSQVPNRLLIICAHNFQSQQVIATSRWT